MVRYALGKGLKLPPEVVALLELLIDRQPSANLVDIINLHNRLAEVIYPAMPATIYLLDADPKRGSLQGYFGPLPNIRYLMATSVIFIVLFVATSLSPQVNAESLAKGIYELTGLDLFMVMLFLMSASGLGACFNALFLAYHYIGDGTYDPRYDSSYWIRIILGIIAGLVMSQLIPIEDWFDTTLQNGSVLSHKAFGKPLLALLGGFSAVMVYTVLQRLVETVESLFKGGPTASIARREQAVRAKLEQQFSENRLSAAGDLLALKEAINNNAAPDRVVALLSKALNRLAPGVGGSDAS